MWCALMPLEKTQSQQKNNAFAGSVFNGFKYPTDEMISSYNLQFSLWVRRLSLYSGNETI